MLSGCLARQRESLCRAFEIIYSAAAFFDGGIGQMPLTRLNELDALRGLMLVLMTLTHESSSCRRREHRLARDAAAPSAGALRAAADGAGCRLRRGRHRHWSKKT